MAQELKGCRIAVLATDGFEQSELVEPLRALRDAGAEAQVVAPKAGEIQGWEHHEKGDKIAVDRTLDQARPDEFDALALPGGVMNPDALRLEPEAIAFVRGFVQADKPIAAICHGPWTLIDAGGVKGKRMTSWPSLKTDLENAGANWVNQEVCIDGKLVTSRKPDDLPAFCREMIRTFAAARQPVPAL